MLPDQPSTHPHSYSSMGRMSTADLTNMLRVATNWWSSQVKIQSHIKQMMKWQTWNIPVFPRVTSICGSPYSSWSIFFRTRAKKAAKPRTCNERKIVSTCGVEQLTQQQMDAFYASKLRLHRIPDLKCISRSWSATLIVCHFLNILLIKQKI